MAEFKQNGDGSVSIVSEQEGIEVFRAGGTKTPSGSVPTYRGNILKLNCNGGIDTGGGLTSWQNNLGYDIIVIGFTLDVTTIAAAACTASFGQTATNGTTSSTSFISAKDVHTATGTFPAATSIAVKVPQGTWITGSVGTGASAGLVGNAYIEYVPV